MCNSFLYHAPCLIDLETGNLIELDLYFPHETKAAELVDPQPQIDTFLFVHLGDVTGTKLTGSKVIEIDIPIAELQSDLALCELCRGQIHGSVINRYMLADLYDRDNKNLIPIQAGLAIDLRCYRITTQKEEDILKIFVKGTLE